MDRAFQESGEALKGAERGCTRTPKKFLCMKEKTSAFSSAFTNNSFEIMAKN